jgi:hypothetical protein
MLAIINARDARERIMALVTFVIFVFIWMFLLRFLWNEALVRYIPALRPVDSLWHTFLLAIGIAAFRL